MTLILLLHVRFREATRPQRELGQVSSEVSAALPYDGRDSGRIPSSEVAISNLLYFSPNAKPVVFVLWGGHTTSGHADPTHSQPPLPLTLSLHVTTPKRTKPCRLSSPNSILPDIPEKLSELLGSIMEKFYHKGFYCTCARICGRPDILTLALSLYAAAPFLTFYVSTACRYPTPGYCNLPTYIRIYDMDTMPCRANTPTSSAENLQPKHGVATSLFFPFPLSTHFLISG